MATPTIVGNASNTFSGGSNSNGGVLNVACPLPAGAAAGDLLLFSVTAGSNGTWNTWAPASGVSSIRSVTGFTTGITNYTNGAEAMGSILLTAAHVAAGFVVVQNASFIVAQNATANGSVLGTVLRGAAVAVDRFAAAGTQNTSTIPAISSPLTGVDDVIVVLGSRGGGISLTPASGYTALGSDPSSYLYHQRRTALSGPSGSTVAAVTAGASQQATWAHVAVKANTSPNAPTLTAPADAASVNRGATLAHSWTFSDPDGDAQAGFDLRYRLAGTSSDWTVVANPTAGASTTYTAPANRYAGTIEWQVRAYDTNGAVSPWSSSRTFTALDAGTPTPSSATSQVGPLALLGFAQHGTGRGNLPNYATADLPSDGAVGRLVYDTTTAQVKVKTDATSATYALASGVTKAQGIYIGNGAAGRAIPVGFAPDLVLVSGPQSSNSYTGLAVVHNNADGVQNFVSAGGAVSPAAVLTSTGFTLTSTTLLNNSSFSYSWTAFKLS